MNLLQLREQTRRRTGISLTSVLSNSALDAILNNGYRIFSTKIAEINQDFFEEQKSKFNLALNSSLYSLPTDTIKVKQIRLAYTTPNSEDDYKVASFYDPVMVNNVSADELDTSTSNPIVDITNNYFRVYPKATSAITNGGEIYYIALPSALSVTGDSPIIPTSYHDLISVYASKEICADKSLFDKYNLYKREVEEGINQMLSELTPREIGKGERMRSIFETVRNNQTRELY